MILLVSLLRRSSPRLRQYANCALKEIKHFELQGIGKQHQLAERDAMSAILDRGDVCAMQVRAESERLLR